MYYQLCTYIYVCIFILRTPTANSPATRVESCSPASVNVASGVGNSENSEKILKKSAFDFSELDRGLEECKENNKSEDL